MARHSRSRRRAGSSPLSGDKTYPCTPSDIANRRFASIDALRGFAVCMMIAYHFLFDTTYFGYTHFDMLATSGWIVWRNAIVSSFLLLAGLSFVLSAQFRRRRAWARNVQLTASAALVTTGSYLVFPASFIYFGVLHFNLFAALIAPFLLRLGKATIPFALLILFASLTLHSPAFDPKFIDWVGFAEHKPFTEDYVPIVPWLALILIGIAMGQRWQSNQFSHGPLLQRIEQIAPKWLLCLGQHSLMVYLLHQPVLFGGFLLLQHFVQT